MGKALKIITNEKVYLPVIYILIGILIYNIISGIISKLMKKHLTNGKIDKRKDTIFNLIKSIIKYLIAMFIIIGILGLYGVNITAILASVGIFAAVIGLAFQDIIKDFLAGVAIIFDNKYSVGDTVDINGFYGTVISLGLRTTKIKAFTGEVKSINNSSFTEVTNYNMFDADIFMKLNVGYQTDIEKLEKVLEGIKDDILKIENVKDYKLLGLDEFASSSLVYVVDIKCKAMTILPTRRSALKIIKKAFDKANIEIPYTKIDVNIKK